MQRPGELADITHSAVSVCWASPWAVAVLNTFTGWCIYTKGHLLEDAKSKPSAVPWMATWGWVDPESRLLVSRVTSCHACYLIVVCHFVPDIKYIFMYSLTGWQSRRFFGCCWIKSMKLVSRPLRLGAYSSWWYIVAMTVIHSMQHFDNSVV